MYTYIELHSTFALHLPKLGGQYPTPSQLVIYSMKVNIYIGFWTLKMKCAQYGICEKVTVKNGRAMVFSEVGRVEKIPVSLRVAALPVSTSPERLVGGNVWGELVFSVMASGWFCEKSG